jgi:citrate synthase
VAVSGKNALQNQQNANRTISSLSTLYPEANPSLAGTSLYTQGPTTAGTDSSSHSVSCIRNKQIWRLLGKIPTIVAAAYRHRLGREFNHPGDYTDYCENFLYMLDKLNEREYKPDEKLAKILDRLFILLAGNIEWLRLQLLIKNVESGSSTSAVTMRHLSSSGVDP